MPAPIDFRCDAVLRQSPVSGSPTFTRLGVFGTARVDWTRQLNEPGDLRFTVWPETLEVEIQAAMRDLAANPLEAWLYLDGGSSPVFAGPVVGFGPSQSGTSVVARGLQHYLSAMAVEVDYTYTGIDVFTIVKGLIDEAQARTRGHFGLVTGTIGTRGITATHAYLRAEDHKLSRRIADLAEGRFDIRVNPATRDVELAAVHGLDLTGAVTVDRRNIVDPGASVSADWEDLVSVVLGTGTGPDGLAFTSTATNTATLATLGRVVGFASWDDIHTQAELDARTAAYAAARAGPLFAPSLNLVPVADVNVGDFTVGDTVLHRYDYGFGPIESAERVSTLKVSADRSNGETTLSVSFV